MIQRRLCSVLLLGTVLHALWLGINPNLSWWRDHIIYNALWIALLILLLQAHENVDHVGLASLALAIFFWGCGSFLAGANEFSENASYFERTSQFCYLLFYPLLLISIPRLVGFQRKLRPVEVLDSIIFGLGFTSMIASVLIATIFSHSLSTSAEDFLLVLYPMGDISLLLAISLILIRTHLKRRTIYLLIGITLFTLTDVYYLYLFTHHSYTFSSVIDDGWLISLIFLVLGVFQPHQPQSQERSIHPVFIALSIFLSPILLALSALNPGLIPIYVVIPSIANLILAFIRMNGAIREAKAFSEEKVLARTDELTGLPNRRRMIAEIENFSTVEGALLLLDLNRFKPVNDYFGHEIGDSLLREVAKRLSRSIPEGDLLARLGGDEFGALIKGDAETTLDIAHALAAALSYPFRIKGHTISIGVSIGHVFNDGQGRLLERADIAMYQAKRNDAAVMSSSTL